ncbi:hypothetical protein H8356DRAFT_1323204 [Neocallimastix lanati (nom. inval.)]|nr:hypothetical protein H8356DRAFT_1323204 [Neocallimastix sp. JGI-2020a]
MNCCTMKNLLHPVDSMLNQYDKKRTSITILLSSHTSKKEDDLTEGFIIDTGTLTFILKLRNFLVFSSTTSPSDYPVCNFFKEAKFPTSSLGGHTWEWDISPDCVSPFLKASTWGNAIWGNATLSVFSVLLTVTSATLSGPLLGQGGGYSYLLTETLTTIYRKTFCSGKTQKWLKGGVELGALRNDSTQTNNQNRT